MHLSTRAAVGVHILTLLAGSEGHPLSSEEVAGSVNTNPAVIRRVLQYLSRAGLVTSRLGAGGGSLLARAPRDITLADVYRAVEPGDLFTLHDRPNPLCPVGRAIVPELDRHFGRATRALEASLEQVTIADVLASALATRPKPSGRAARSA
jgi:Rrf2 family protein